MRVTDPTDGADATLDFNPTVSPHRDDPHGFYRLARERPVALSPTIGAYLVSRYIDVQTVLEDPDTFSARSAFPLIYDNPPEVVAELLAAGVPERRRLVDEDSAQHRQIRALIDVGVSGERLRSLMPFIRERACDLVSSLDGGTAELVREYAMPYVQAIIDAVIGFPSEDSDRVEAWTRDSFVLSGHTASIPDKIAAARRLGDYTRYLQTLIDKRRAHPQEDLISVLVHGANGIPAMTNDDQIHGTIRGTRVAGYPTTLGAITTTTLLVLQNPAVLAEVLDRPTRTIIKASEEALRRDGPNRGVYRYTTREVELGGTVLPEGAKLLLLFDSANRDDVVFPEPDAVKLDRPNVHDHMTFGKGLHACPGAPVARAEITIALRTLFEKLPGLRLADGYEPTYTANYLVRGLESLHVCW